MLNYISAVSVHENREFFPSAQSNKNCNDVLIIFIFESQAGVWRRVELKHEFGPLYRFHIHNL